MKKALGLVIVLMLLSWSVATVHPVKAAPSANETVTPAYDAFWEILNREAELYAQVVKGNDSAIPELINNSRLGAENAVNISTLIWESVEELKASGVKTYYTADELRAMAENISKNGLPNETVQELKAQGWTDEQIKALEEYIAKNADNITEDFNMTAFLQNFSTAFMKVAFKYNHYEAWALKRLANPSNSNIPYATTWSEETEVPFIWNDFKEFNRTFSNASLDEKLNLTRSLKEKISSFITNSGEKILYRNYTILYARNASEYRKCFAGRPQLPIRRELNSTYSWLRNSTVHQIDNMTITSIRNFLENFTSTDSLPIGVTSTVKVLKVIPQEDSVVVMIITRSFTMYFSSKDCSTHFSYYRHYDMYYWKGFKAYEKLSNLGTILEAKLLGNENSLLDEMMENITQNISEYFKTYRRGESEFRELIINRLISPPNDPRPPIFQKVNSTPMSGNEGHLYIDVTVNNAHVTEDYATYRVRVSLRAMNNVVTDVNVEVEGTGLSDSTHYGMIHPDDGVITWYSDESNEVYGSGSVSVSGTVRVTYTPSCGDLPNSGSVPLTCNQPTTITEDYSKTIHLGDTIDPDKVSFYIIPSDSRIRRGESMTFYVKVVNENDEPVNGSYELNIAVPDENGHSSTITKRGDISLSPNDNSGLIPVTTVTYTETGTYGYSGTFKFNGYEKHDDGDIIVESDDGGSSGSLSIESVSVSPQEPRDGSAVNFTVKVKSTYPTGQNMRLELFVDGSVVDSTQGVINANSEGTFVLRWLAQAGEHSYTVKAYTLIGGQEFIEDEESGSVSVASPSQQFAVKLEASPTELEGGGTVYFTVKVWNFENSAIPLSGFVKDENGTIVKSIDGFEGRVPANAQNYTLTAFSLDVYGVGNHTFKLFLDNADGEPNGAGEEHWSEVTVEVKPTNGTLKQVGFECKDIYFDFRDRAYRATLVCKVYLYNPLESALDVRDVAVLQGYSLGDLEDVTGGSLSTGEWTINPSAFSLNPQETKTVTFSLPLEIGSWVPISVADATEVVSKYGEHVTINFQYTLGYTYNGSEWKHFEGEVQEIVQVRMDAKTVAADYMLSGINAVFDPNTMLSVSVGQFKLSGINVNAKIGFDPWAFIWNGFLKPWILEHT